MKHISRNLNLPPFCRCLFLWKWCNPFPRARARLKHAHSFDRCGAGERILFIHRAKKKKFTTLKNTPFPLNQSIEVHRRALVLLLCLIPCHRCEKSVRESRNSHHFITQRDNIHARAHDTCVDQRGSGAIIGDGDRKSWDSRGPMIWDNFSIFRTNCAILTSWIHARVVGSRVDVVTLRDQLVRVARFSCRFFTAMAGNKAEKKNQGSSVYFYALM